MADLQQMSRILYHHDWVNVEDWACNVAQLADLSDEEIRQLEAPRNVDGSDGKLMARENLLSGSAMRGSLIARTRERVAVFCGGLRLGLRRAY
jgi:hypothetical protein